MKYNITETKKLRIQEEANYIIAEMQRIHRQCDHYEIEIEDTKIAMKNCEGPINGKVISERFNFRGTSYWEGKVDAKRENANVDFNLFIKDLENEKLNVELNTRITRYKVQ
ncbi:hypothetical protein [Sporosarcina luteola]|uniref:hypothetical protein n=1 Tax=Sporosarcina luteola TaxID=582850 RepID=UPI00203E8BA6|nr:hypothetical protein [Sporosarcina luteola]MCM3710755.1 hypothetical protein [Sporosarcina luteola]